MSDFSVLRWGVVGAGKISTDFVSAVQVDSPDKHRFVAVASKSLESASKFASARNIPKSYGCYQDLANDPEVQAVYIGNLNPEHFETAKLFLEHNKHVLMEKPLTMSAKLTTELSQLARSKNLLLMEALWSRFLPAYRFIAEQIEKGTIGDIYQVNVSFGFAALDQVERISKKSLGGGTILDLGVYTLNVIQMAYRNQTPKKVLAVGNVNSDGVDLSVSAALEYAGGRTATMCTHAIVELPNEAYILGTKGYMKLLKFFHCCQEVELNGQVHEFKYPENTPEMNFPNGRGLRYEADEFRRLLQAGKTESDIMPHADSITIASIQEEIRRQLGVFHEQ